VEAIQTKKLSKVYKDIGKGRRKSLDSLNLTVQQGEVFGFLGRNGAGKTTTIKLLCGLIKATEGDAFLFGESIRTRKSRRLVGYLPEQPYFYEYLTPRETIDFYGRLQGLDATERAATWDRLSERLELKAIADQRLKGFSKGMRQRIGFAVALVGDPPLLILDEPMSGLDPLGRRSIRDLIVQCRDEGKTVFFSSHVLADVELICDRIAILVEGRLTREGSLDTLLRGEITPCEVVVAKLPETLENEWASAAQSHRRHDGLARFVFPDTETANRATCAMLEAGALLESFTPIKTRLEDYFIQEQARDGKAAEAVS